ncbi:MAG TPA: tyrosine-type recombinase/integrase [Magnetospirillum sp.]|nr:tyrosine-type recombinase/integrase [Magnetospirillum sp.]
MPKVAKPLTDYVVKTLKPAREQSGWKDVADGGCRGLILRLSPRGEKTWAVRMTVGGRREFHTLGAYPTVSLADARKRAGEYLSAARDGITAEAVDARTRALSLTLANAHSEYIETVGPSLRDTTRKLKQGMFSTHIEPVAGRRLIRNIRRADVVEVVGAVTAKGLPVQANRVFSEMMALLRWCEQKGYVDGVPSIRKKDMRNFGAAKEQARRRTLSDAEIKEVWEASENLGVLSRDLIRLLLLTGQRRDEVRLMTWEEMDLEQSLWTIPAARYKTGIDHAVPLSKPVVDILKARWSEGATGYVLRGRNDDKPFNGAASTLRRLREAMDKRPPFTLHDMRRTVRTGLSRLGVDDETAEMVIGHLPQGIVRVYNLHDRLEQRRKALEKWATLVGDLHKPRNNVIPMKASAG